MFNLDQAISEWRRQMMSAGIKSRDVLDELESHLRDDLEQQMRAGATVESAFREAVRRVGGSEILKGEFAKVHRCGARFSHATLRAMWMSTAAFVFVIEAWTLVIYDVTVFERIFGIAMVALIAGYIGALPDLNKILWRDVRGWALRKAITLVCSYATIIWVCLLYLGLMQVNVLPLGIVAGTICWGLIAAMAMTMMVFACTTEQEALDLWSPAAWQCFELAGAEAARFRHDFIGTEHVLLGLLSEENGKVRRVLEKCGVDRETQRVEIEKMVGLGPQSRGHRQPPFTPRAKKAFQFAIREAKAAQAIRAEPEHVLVGLLDGCGGVAAMVLNALGVDANKARAEIRKQAEGEANDRA